MHNNSLTDFILNAIQWLVDCCLLKPVTCQFLDNASYEIQLQK